MKLLTILLMLILSACSVRTALVTRSFPSIPKSLSEPCPPLLMVPKNTEKLSEIISIVTTNYALYHECSIRVEMWQTWYIEQKELFIVE